MKARSRLTALRSTARMLIGLRPMISVSSVKPGTLAASSASPSRMSPRPRRCTAPPAAASSVRSSLRCDVAALRRGALLHGVRQLVRDQLAAGVASRAGTGRAPKKMWLPVVKARRRAAAAARAALASVWTRTAAKSAPKRGSMKRRTGARQRPPPARLPGCARHHRPAPRPPARRCADRARRCCARCATGVRARSSAGAVTRRRAGDRAALRARLASRGDDTRSAARCSRRAAAAAERRRGTLDLARRGDAAALMPSARRERRDRPARLAVLAPQRRSAARARAGAVAALAAPSRVACSAALRICPPVSAQRSATSSSSASLTRGGRRARCAHHRSSARLRHRASGNSSDDVHAPRERGVDALGARWW